MLPLRYAKLRLSAVLSETHRLQESEFPYSHSEKALSVLESMFKSSLSRLEKLTEKNSQEVIDRECAQSLRILYQYLPLLGFILRSTNVRNAFELFHPLLSVAKQLLEPGANQTQTKTRLLLSSEWEYSPLVYSEIPALPGFVLIGFPATESGNGLLAPLAGHELGHSLWSIKKCRKKADNVISNHLLDAIIARSGSFEDVFGRQEISEEDLTTDMFLLNIWQPAQAWALSQAEETFCDLVALKVFGRAYMHSFAYLLSPSLSMPRSVRYPALKTRAENIAKGAEKYEITVPDNFMDLFEEENPTKLGIVDKFLLEVADESLTRIFDFLIEQAEQYVKESDVPMGSQDEVDRIISRFELAVPATDCKSFTDILNAAWLAYDNEQLWSDSKTLGKNRDEILSHLILKTAENFEIEQLTG